VEPILADQDDRGHAGSGVAGWAAGFRGLLPRAIGLTGLTIAGQLSFLVALPLLSRLFPPTALGLFTIYLSIVNIGGPLVELKFESALFGLADRPERCASLRLSILVIALNSLCVGSIALLLAPRLAGDAGDTLRALVLILPFGLFLSGAWSASTAWAVRENALRTLSIARFVQPASMTLFQVLFGLLHWSAISLVAAHLASHALYSGLILMRTVSADDRRDMLAIPHRMILRRAYRDRRLPLYVMPSFLISTLVANAPPLLMGMVFGTGLAGQYGIAYRVVTSPLSIICLPLGIVVA
jgi:O-antigen/teichoic acid export membrane protein